jgi:CRISPR/Cas system CSM-associated protein Csm3 (group 7 of RAMP superfamily)
MLIKKFKLIIEVGWRGLGMQTGRLYGNIKFGCVPPV